MILVLDNYDSFTFNLVQYLGELSCEVDVRRNDAISVEDVSVMTPEAIVISPGPCTPAEAGISVALVRRWDARYQSGVCLGHRAIVEATVGVSFARQVMWKTSNVCTTAPTSSRCLHRQ
jgi:anthranilate synthase/aminodeoxychorismate synthase-like glutamine amidotransferase